MNKDIIEKEFEYKGHHCVIRFKRLGYRCGYVSTKYEYDYHDLPQIKCFGGLTYSGKMTEESKRWYIGFDCLNNNSEVDLLASKQYNLISEEEYNRLKKELSYMDGTPKSKEFVEEECKRIVDQLEDMENKDEAIIKRYKDKGYHFIFCHKDTIYAISYDQPDIDLCVIDEWDKNNSCLKELVVYDLSTL